MKRIIVTIIAVLFSLQVSAKEFSVTLSNGRNITATEIVLVGDKYSILTKSARIYVDKEKISNIKENIKQVTLTTTTVLFPKYVVTYVSDGDTITVDNNGSKEKIRLYGIDSPEYRQPYGIYSKKYLQEVLEGKQIRVDRKGKDIYGRTIATIYVQDSKNVNEMMVSSGNAWWYQEYAQNDKNLETLQDKARINKVGLWKYSNPTPPWEYRIIAQANAKAFAEKKVVDKANANALHEKWGIELTNRLSKVSPSVSNGKTNNGSVSVKGYTRKDGTNVKSYTRSSSRSYSSRSSSSRNSSSRSVSVKAYTRKDGTRVKAHTRSR